MADVAGSLYDYPPVYSGTFGTVVDGVYYPLGSEGVFSPGPTLKYKMRAQDSLGVAPAYVTWVATDSPDFGSLPTAPTSAGPDTAAGPRPR